MNRYALVYPMAAMVVLTAIVLGRMFLGRVRGVKRGEVDVRYYKTYQGDGEPRSMAQHSRHFVNLFENPVLFYAACVVAMVTGQGTGAIVWLAWAYVACRIGHAFVHLGSNRIPPRIAMYAAGWTMLLAMWGVLVFGVAAHGQ
ncbi:MAG: MAPEG family protein [Proteobacteria bacterium]|nr:MAPEG family protein [Pseudomonadota bacterium]